MLNSTDAPDLLLINRPVQFLLMCTGAGALCLYFRTWQDMPHVFYDIPAALAMSAYIAQLLCESHNYRRCTHWWVRWAMLLPMAVIAGGRDFFGWTISGHLTDILAVALVQSLDKRLSRFERIMYFMPLPVILYTRWFVFDKVDLHGHTETFNAVIVGLCIFTVYGITVRIADTIKERSGSTKVG